MGVTVSRYFLLAVLVITTDRDNPPMPFFETVLVVRSPELCFFAVSRIAASRSDTVIGLTLCYTLHIVARSSTRHLRTRSE